MRSRPRRGCRTPAHRSRGRPRRASPGQPAADFSTVVGTGRRLVLSGRARYTYSKTILWVWVWRSAWTARRRRRWPATRPVRCRGRRRRRRCPGRRSRMRPPSRGRDVPITTAARRRGRGPHTGCPGRRNARQNAPRTVGRQFSAACSRRVGGAVGEQRADDVGIRGGGRGAARPDQPGFAGAACQLRGVDQVAVVPERHSGACGGVTKYRLGVFRGRGAGSGVAAVANGDVATPWRQASAHRKPD